MDDLIICIYVGVAGVIFGLLLLTFNRNNSRGQKDLAVCLLGCGAVVIVLEGGFLLEFFLMSHTGWRSCF